MKIKRLLIILGIVLILIQCASIVGMQKVYVGLYPDNDDFMFHTYNAGKSDFTIKKALFAVEAGFDRFQTGFDDLNEDDKYRTMSSTQMTSAMIRESLGCSEGGSTGLKLYDTILTVSYSITGLLGIGLLVISCVINRMRRI